MLRLHCGRKHIEVDQENLWVIDYGQTEYTDLKPELPSKELLQRQLHKGLEAARQRWENYQEN